MWTSHSPPFPWTENEDESVIVYTFLRKMLVFAAKGIARRCSLSCRQWDLPAVSWYFLVCHDFLDFSRYFLIACLGTCRVGWWKCWKKLEFEDSHTTMIDKGMTLNRSMVTIVNNCRCSVAALDPFTGQVVVILCWPVGASFWRCMAIPRRRSGAWQLDLVSIFTIHLHDYLSKEVDIL